MESSYENRQWYLKAYLVKNLPFLCFCIKQESRVRCVSSLPASFAIGEKRRCCRKMCLDTFVLEIPVVDFQTLASVEELF